MRKYLVATCDKVTLEVNFECLEATCPNDDCIVEYIDGMGSVLWAVYGCDIPYDVARTNFAKYVEHCLGVCV